MDREPKSTDLATLDQPKRLPCGDLTNNITAHEGKPFVDISAASGKFCLDPGEGQSHLAL